MAQGSGPSAQPQAKLQALEPRAAPCLVPIPMRSEPITTKAVKN